MAQQLMLQDAEEVRVEAFSTGLLKWIGNKQRVAHLIASYFPRSFRTYFEPFVGSAAVLSTLSPQTAVASDRFGPLIEIWKALTDSPAVVKSWYRERWDLYKSGDRVVRYEEIKASYNRRPNGADLLFLCRACYGGVVRFRKADGAMSTPCGIHEPMRPESFNRRVDEWAERLKGARFELMGYEEAMEQARPGDMIYCDPPYADSQTILYGAQAFDLQNLYTVVDRCKSRGIHVALSLDGTKRSGTFTVDVHAPIGLFEREILIDSGRSMLRRFQLAGKSLESEVVAERLLLTY